MTTLNLDTIDNWDFSVTPESHYVEVIASSPRGMNNGWYNVVVDYDGNIVTERRMLADGNYDHHPVSNRPPMTTMIAKIPPVNRRIINALKEAFEPIETRRTT